MDEDCTTLWTIQQLAARVAGALAVDAPGAPNGRVREVPDLRTIRYYTTLGLLDRPAAMEGRTALYGVRHLRQLVAIKRLQARGLSLLEIQREFAGITEERLHDLAGIPDEASNHVPSSPAVSPRPDAGRFWKSRPSRIAEESPTGAPLSTASEEVRSLQAIQLETDVTLLLNPLRPLVAADLAGLRRAAAPLIRHLRKQRMIPQPPKGDDDEQAPSPDD